MKPLSSKIISRCAALFAGALGVISAQAFPGFTGSYTNNFDAIGTSGTTLPSGFASMVIAGGNTTYTAASPITAAGIATATLDTQTLTIWNAGSAVASSGTTTFNIGCWDSLSDRALGTDPTGTAANVIQLGMTNNTGSTLAGVTFYYDCKCLTNGSAGTEQTELPGYCFFYSTTGTNAAANWTEVGVAGNAALVGGIPTKNGLCLPNYTQGTTMSSGPVTILFATPLTNGGPMYFRWADDNNQSSSPDQEIAIDNVGITGIPAVGPYASLTSPANNANFIPGSNVVITATAGDYSSTVTNVEFFANTIDLGGVTTAPYSLTNSSLAIGSYALTAVASDAAGLSVTSAVVNITVAYVPPAVSITSPANSANFAPGSSVTITATASDVDSTVTNVQFYANGTNNLGNVTSAPYTLTWPTVPAGSYALTAVASDAVGLAKTSSVVNITLSFAQPTVSLTSPASGSTFVSPAAISLAATAASSDATVTNVGFYQGTSLIANVTASPYTYTWNVAAAGAYSLTARVTDSYGLIATSSVVSITVTNPLVTSFTGVYTQNFDLALSNSTTVMPAGFMAMTLPGSHFTYTNLPGSYITSTGIVTAATGSATLVLWNFGSAVASAGSQLFNVGTWTNANDRALGSDPTGTAGTVIQLAMTNNSGNPLAGVVFSYDELCLTNGSTSNGAYTDDGTERLELPGYSFFYCIGNTGVATNWIAVSALQMTNWVQGSETPSGPVTITFPTPLPLNAIMYFRWADDNCVASSPDQLYAIDNISITSVSASGPLASLTSPANGASFLPGSNVVITATASDTSSTVTNVEFYANGTALGGVTTAPYSLTNSSLALGSYALTAVAQDALGLMATSSVVNITVAYVPPTVSITSPANNATFAPGSSVAIMASASDTDSTVTNVAFYSGSTLLGNVTTAPYNLTWPTVPAGSYALTVVASDALGLSSTSTVVNITLAFTPPAVTLTSPANGASYASFTSIPLSATVTDTQGTVTNVAFYQGSTLLANVTTAPYNYTWANVPAGAYSVTAQATDNNGATATSASASITVTNSFVASFTGVYTENFDLDLSNATTVMPAGFQAMYLPGSHFTYTNAPGQLITSTGIVTAVTGTQTLVPWSFGSPVSKASYQLFNIVTWTNANDLALGTDPTGTAGTVIQLALANNTGGNLSGVTFSYDELCLTNGSTSNGSYTDDGTERLELPGYSFFYSLTGDTNPTNWIAVSALQLTNWVQGTETPSGPVAIVFPTPLTNGGVMYFRWADDNCVASSPDQMYAIDNVSVTSLDNSFLTVYDAGAGFSGGENLILTNLSGGAFYAWGSADPTAPVTSWTPLGQLSELPLGTSGYSRYGINVNPSASPTYYIFAQTNVGPYTASEALTWLTTPDFSTFTVNGGNIPISAAGVFQISGVASFIAVSIASPTNTENYTPYTGAITVNLNASDTVSTITNVAVNFTGANTYSYNLTSAPYTLAIAPGDVAPGSYAITAVASDAAGLMATSAVVNITVAYVPPTVSLTSPVTGSSFPAPANLSLAASAASSDGTVASVSFYQGATLLASVSSAPFNYTWASVFAGSYNLTAQVTDSHGLIATSSVVAITVTNGYGLPTISLTSPANNANFLPGANVAITASASESGGTITNVEFYANSINLGGVASAPYSLTWSNVSAGAYALTATASDSAGNTTTSGVVNVTVHVPPTVSLTSPANNANYGAPATITLTATASDTDGTVTNVAFYQGSTLLATVASAPYTYTWANVSAGSYALTAVATDNSHSLSTSGPVNITVTNTSSVSPALAQIKTIFVIALENHDFTQANPTGSPEQLLGNPACPYFNSLITPGNSNAMRTAYATHYYSCNIQGEHPSEPNYVWSEAGTDFGVQTDNDPTSGNNQWSNVQHLSGQLTAAGIPWRTYQEDVKYSSSEEVSASGSGASVNPYNGTTEYNYAVKHNPMAFYTDTQNKNCYEMSQLFTDLTNNNVGRYNWITPDMYNEMHSSLPSGFTYHGTAYTGDQAAIAEGDNCLSILIPRIMASQAYQSNGVIIIWTDETESTDDTGTTLPFVIISPLAKGNAYASTLPYNHSSDLRTMDEIFGLAFQTNAIPSSEHDAQNDGKYNYVDGHSATINDFTDFFQAPAAPAPAPALVVQQSGTTLANGANAAAFGSVNVGANLTETFTVTNSGNASLVLSNVVATGANAGDFTVSGITLPASLVAGGSTSFSVVFSPLGAGARSAILQVTDNDTNNNPFTLGLSGTGVHVPPTVSLTSPANGASFPAPASLMLAATAADTDGAVTNVAFYAGTTLLGNATSAPFTFTTANLLAGSYALNAVATDDSGATATSSVVNVTITAPVLVVKQAGAPLTNGATAAAFGSVNIGATATATFTVTNTGNGTLILSNLVATGANAGDFTVSGIALPATVVVGGSSSFNVVFAPSVGGAENAALQINDNDLNNNPYTLALTGTGVLVPPTVSLTGPANGASFTAPANLALAATTADIDGTVTNVAFYKGSTLLANVTSAPYTFTTANIFAGSYALTAVATDNNGLSSTSTVVNVTVTNTVALATLQSIKTVFVIAMENHDLVQKNPTGNPQQMLGNPAAPYFNSLITPGNSNAVQTAWATHMFSCAINGEHPSEPNYIWQEAGTDFGIRTDNDPNSPMTSHNVFTNVMHLSGQLTTAGIPWRSYQEDLEYTTSEEVSKSGTTNIVNPYNGTLQYNYGVKHNPMAFFNDTQNQYCYPMTNFWTDLTNNNIGRYNWITPDQYNEWHSALSGGYTYNGVHYTSDQAAIASGDNCLSIIIPRIMASPAYQDHGVIIIWTDETESTDDTNTTLPYVIISPLAKGNAYASTLPYSHASDLKTMDEIFGLAYQTNAIPAADYDAQNDGKYNYVDGHSATIYDLSDFFQGVGTDAPALVVQQSGSILTNGASALAFGAVNIHASVTNTFTVTNAGNGTLVFSNAVATGANASDFTVSGISLPATVYAGQSTNFNVVFSPLGAGTRAATLQFTDNDTNNNPFSLVLSGTGVLVPPTVSISSPTNGQNYIPGSSVYIFTGATDVDTNITSVGLYVDGSLAYTFTSPPYILPIPGGAIPPGSYTIQARATDAAGLMATSAVVNVTIAYVPPTVSLTSPASGSSLAAFSTIPLSAAAASADGTVTNVAFYQGSTLLANVTSAPFTYGWVNTSAGVYAFTALATDSHGLSATSSVVSVTVTNGFGVGITSPANNATYSAGSNIVLAANAAEAGGTIANVEFYANGADMGGAAAAPYSLTWSNVTAGTYALTAAASDASGLAVTSSVVNITVIVPHVPPTVSLTSPANQANLNVVAGLPLSATAACSDGTVTNVAFYMNSLLVANVASAPYNYNWTNPPTGIYTLTAVATDNTGATGTSSPVNITASNSLALATIQQIKTLFIIPLENHDLVQANPQGSPQQLLGNPACPYFNSLITPGNSNALQTAYATHMFSSAINGEHPSEPNYVWSEAGTDFGVRTDNDPSAASGNQFTNVIHLSGQLTAAGIPWRTYQEDVEFSSSELVSASGSSGPVNAYNGTTDYNYAVKHNPMAFFTDTQNKNCYPLTNFWNDLTNGNIGRYNWITPDQYNEMHSSLPSGYTYFGTNYTGDQAAIAEGDNFLSIVIPKIMASQAYQDNGAIIIWTDETESTDDTNTTLPYVIISPLAKGNAYASTLPYSHSSDLKTMDELFGLAYQTNAIPAAYNGAPYMDAQNTALNYVNGSSAPIYDLSDFFVVPVQIGSVTAPTGGNFQMSFAGPAGRTYEVLASDDLSVPQSQWTVVASGTFGSTNVVFSDGGAANHPGRYYVVKSP